MRSSRSAKSARAATALGAQFMLAPAVMALRLPLLAEEAGDLNPWRVETVRAVTEKAAAIVEGTMAAQVSLAISASKFWFEVMAGKSPSLLNGIAVERAMHAALRPSTRRVSGNYRRLSKG
jgi:hypothetical protein